jgi:hypothetical protein
MSKRKGFLTPKTYFPKKGDVLECQEDGTTMTCERVCTMIEPTSGEKGQVALFWLRNPDLKEPMPRAWTRPGTRIEKELAEFDSIYRPRDGDMVEFRKNEKGVFEEV